MSAHAVSASRPRLPAAPRLLLPPLAARLVAFGALGAFGAARWAELVVPGAGGRVWGELAIATVFGLALAALGGTRWRVRGPAVAAALVAALAGALAVGGVGGALLAPAGWSGLADGVRQGVQSLFDVRVPYAGPDPWPAIVLLAGGGLLLLVAAAATFGPRRPRDAARGRALALIALGSLYAVPAIDAPTSHQFLRGAVFALLLAAFLWLDRLPARRAPAAGAAVLAALALGLALAPSLDRGRPWIDYQALARHLAGSGTVSYDFDHRYGPLDWPRNGQELLRVSAPREAYWKAADLDQFDGVRWKRSRQTVGDGATLQGQVPDSPAQLRRWRERVRVTVRGLRSTDVIAAGVTFDVRGTPSPPISPTDPATAEVESPLRQGDSYVADVYFPRPSPRQLATAGSAYPSELGSTYLTLGIPVSQPAPGAPRTVDVRFGAFGSGQPPASVPDGTLRVSPYGPAYALARRLAARSRTPYELVQRVLTYLDRGGFAYSELPPQTRYPLETFLFRDRTGYCQHFSGAMALLLRMAGVPARVAGGFSPGTYDRRRHEWVVRDFDAHSWVEAYFPGYGWVTFDPTPPDSPARSQFVPVDLLPSATAPLRAKRAARRVERAEPGPGAPIGAVPVSGGQGAPVRTIALAGALVLIGVLLAGLLAAGGVRARRAEPATAELQELERALRRCGRPPPPGTTLRALERRFGRDPDAVGYLRAVAERRYGLAGAGPTREHRRALRRALGRGLGATGRLRALWALPPRPRPLH